MCNCRDELTNVEVVKVQITGAKNVPINIQNKKIKAQVPHELRTRSGLMMKTARKYYPFTLELAEYLQRIAPNMFEIVEEEK